jgi:hypothetical protein
VGAETCTPSSSKNYNIIINELDPSRIQLKNLFGIPAQTAIANVSGASFTFPLQDLWINSASYTLSGTGSISGNTITINYKVTKVSASYSCTYVGVK